MQGGALEVVVVTRNSRSHIGPCVDSIVAGGALPIIVDNGSTDETLEIVRARCPEAQIIATGENPGYGKSLNLGFRETTANFVILSNPDVVYLGDSIRQMAEFLEKNPKVGLTGPQQMFPNRTWQRSYGDLPGIWPGIKDAIGITTLHSVVRRAFWPRKVDRKPKDVPYVDGAILAVRREAFQEVGGFDEDFFFYSDESDLCARMQKAGWRTVFLPFAEVMHVRGADSAKVDRSDRFVRYMVRSQTLLANKHLPKWKARVYMRLQVWHFIRLGLMYRGLVWLAGKKSSFADKIWMFDAYARIWKEASRSAQLIPTTGLDGATDERKEALRAN